jgi:hypothetical protein
MLGKIDIYSVNGEIDDEKKKQLTHFNRLLVEPHKCTEIERPFRTKPSGDK